MLPMLMTGTRSTGETVSEFHLGPDEKKYVFQCLRRIESVYRSLKSTGLPVSPSNGRTFSLEHESVCCGVMNGDPCTNHGRDDGCWDFHTGYILK